MNQLVGANNSDLFDALDEGTLLTKTMMDNLMGYQLPESEYKRYFDNHPLRNRYASSYNQFLTASSPQYSMRR